MDSGPFSFFALLVVMIFIMFIPIGKRGEKILFGSIFFECIGILIGAMIAHSAAAESDRKRQEEERAQQKKPAQPPTLPPLPPPPTPSKSFDSGGSDFQSSSYDSSPSSSSHDDDSDADDESDDDDLDRYKRSANIEKCYECNDEINDLHHGDIGDGKCPECQGDGHPPFLEDEPCHKCGGSGKCPECNGKGFNYND